MLKMHSEAHRPLSNVSAFGQISSLLAHLLLAISTTTSNLFLSLSIPCSPSSGTFFCPVRRDAVRIVQHAEHRQPVFEGGFHQHPYRGASEVKRRRQDAVQSCCCQVEKPFEELHDRQGISLLCMLPQLLCQSFKGVCGICQWRF